MFVETVIWVTPRHLAKRTRDEWSCSIYMGTLKTQTYRLQGGLCIEEFRAEFLGRGAQS